jgi:hypothetical protein
LVFFPISICVNLPEIIFLFSQTNWLEFCYRFCLFSFCFYSRNKIFSCSHINLTLFFFSISVCVNLPEIIFLFSQTYWFEFCYRFCLFSFCFYSRNKFFSHINLTLFFCSYRVDFFSVYKLLPLWCNTSNRWQSSCCLSLWIFHENQPKLNSIPLHISPDVHVSVFTFRIVLFTKCPNLRATIPKTL